MRKAAQHLEHRAYHVVQLSSQAASIHVVANLEAPLVVIVAADALPFSRIGKQSLPQRKKRSKEQGEEGAAAKMWMVRSAHTVVFRFAFLKDLVCGKHDVNSSAVVKKGAEQAEGTGRIAHLNHARITTQR